MDEHTDARHAVAAWCDLVTGRSPLVESFVRGGRRFLVLRRRAAAAPWTERERQVLDLARRGISNKRIALELGLSEATVSTLLRAITTKLGLRSRVELVRLFAPAALTEQASPR